MNRVSTNQVVSCFKDRIQSAATVTLILIFTLLTTHLSAQTSFITTWKTNNTGTSNSTSITIPTTGTGYNYNVDWNNDGIFDEFGIAGDVTHDFGTAGTYTIRIQGDFPRIYFNFSGDKEKILSIDQWGGIAWSSMEKAFNGCTNLTYTATDVPDLSNVTSLARMFGSTSSFNGDLSNWNVSNITDMSSMFIGASTFNQDINSWDVSNVEDMSSMFVNANAFNHDLSSWNVSNVTNMTAMFNQANAFNGDLSSWDVTNVTTMRSMFLGADSFNNNISSWNVSNVTDMHFMFSYTAAFNQDISSWDVSSVIDMGEMFYAADAFDQNLGSWNISAVGFMGNMLTNSALSIANYDATLIGWESQSVQPGVNLGALRLSYCSGESARASLITNNGWTISGDRKTCSLTPFITTWKTDNTGISNSTSITIPTTGTGYNYDVDWNNDGIFDQFGITGDVTHDFGSVGTYAIGIRGSFPRIYFNFSGDREKILSIDQWGGIAWSSMEKAFNGCTNLTYTATDVPDLSNVTSLERMFGSTSSFNGDLSNWDVSNITDMSSMFIGASTFNQDINSWDVSNVEDMSSMFVNANVFNHDLSSWNVSNVTNMTAMFNQANAFNGDLSSWDVTNVTTMRSMFLGADSFNNNISSWNVSNVTDMHFMFSYTTAFNQDISNWDVSSVIDMGEMFYAADAFNQNLGSWNISAVGFMGNMLTNSALSIASYDATLIGWESQSVQPGVNLGALGLSYCSGESARASLIINNGWTISGDSLDCLNRPFITTWKTDNPGVSGSTSITIPTTGTGYNYDVDWNNDGIFDEFGITGNVTHDFGSAGTYTIAIQGAFPRIYFFGLGDHEKIVNINQWGGINWTSMENAFQGCDNLIASATDAPNLSNVTSTKEMFKGASIFNGDLSNWDVSNITDLSSMFYEAGSFNSDISAWNVSNVLYMHFLFFRASSFNSDLSLWDVSNVTNMSSLFQYAGAFNQDISNWNVSSVTNMSAMFLEAEVFNQDIGSWNVSNVTNMASMFRATKDFNSDLTFWDVSNVTVMKDMFRSTKSFDEDISTWDITNVTNMSTMFKDAEVFNNDLSSWDVSNVTNMSNMFSNTGAFDQNLGNWDISQVTEMNSMLTNSALSTANYDATLIGWKSKNVQSGVSLGAGGLKYCAGENARDSLISVYGWTIYGDNKGTGEETTVYAQSCNPADTGTTVEVFSYQYGCDLTVTTITTFVSNYDIQIFKGSCDPADTGVVFINETSVQGCDSMVTVTTELWPSYNITLYDTTCVNSLSGSRTEMEVTVHGCDSLVTTITTVTQNAEANFDYQFNSNFGIKFTDQSINADTWEWDFGDGGSSSLPNPDHAYETTGTFIVSLTVTNDCNVDTKSDTIHIISTSVTEINKMNLATIYPNPVAENIHLTFKPAGQIELLEISIMDIKGHILKSQSLDTQIKDHVIDISQFANGVYILNIKNEHSQYSTKVIKH